MLPRLEGRLVEEFLQDGARRSVRWNVSVSLQNLRGVGRHGSEVGVLEAQDDRERQAPLLEVLGGVRRNRNAGHGLSVVSRVFRVPGELSLRSNIWRHRYTSVTRQGTVGTLLGKQAMFLGGHEKRKKKIRVKRLNRSRKHKTTIAHEQDQQTSTGRIVA